MEKPGQERRKRIRIEAPLGVRIIGQGDVIYQATTKDISPLGLRFEVKKEGLSINDEVELTLDVPSARSPVHAKAKVVWTKKLAGGGDSSFDIGCEFTEVEEDNKNTFLKYFCALLYEKTKETTLEREG